MQEIHTFVNIHIEIKGGVPLSHMLSFMFQKRLEIYKYFYD